MTSETAGVRFPPPLIFALGLLIGLGLDRLVPLDVFQVFHLLSLTHAPLAWRVLLALPFLVIGLGLILSAASAFRRANTTIHPWGRASFLVPTGPYRFSRNPMYLGMALAHVAAALIMGSPWALVLLPVVLLIVRRYVIAREERHLRGRFGADYDAYAGRVRRWF